MKRFLIGPLFLLLCACSAPPKSDVPPLNPEEANSLLHYDSKASGWLTYVRKQNPGCAYHVELPDQASNPTEIDLANIVWCGASPAAREFSASVVFVYDKTEKRWKLQRFSS